VQPAGPVDSDVGRAVGDALSSGFARGELPVIGIRRRHVPIDPPAEIEQNSNTPSKAGLSSFTPRTALQ
jgi:hypothetical protein